MNDLPMIIGVRGGGKPRGLVHAATTAEQVDPLDFTALCGATFNGVYKVDGKRALFVDFLNGEFVDTLPICQDCANIYLGSTDS